MQTERIIDYTARVTNTGEKYSITGNVNVQGEKLNNIHDAVVCDMATGDDVASFSFYTSLNVVFNEKNAEENSNILDEINVFIESAETSVSDGSIKNVLNS